MPKSTKSKAVMAPVQNPPSTGCACSEHIEVLEGDLADASKLIAMALHQVRTPVPSTCEQAAERFAEARSSLRLAKKMIVDAKQMTKAIRQMSQ